MRGDFVQELAKLPKTEIQQSEGDPASIRVKLEQFAAPELRPIFGGKIWEISRQIHERGHF